MALSRVDRTKVREVAAELAVYRPGEPQLHSAMGAIHELLGGKATGLFSLAEANGGLALTRTELIGFPPRFHGLFADFFRTAPRRYSVYDAIRPEPDQRNRVIEPIGALMRDKDYEDHPLQKRVFEPAGIGSDRQLRTLLCEGASLLGWFGITSQEKIRPRQRQVLAALAGPVRRRLLLERRMAQGARAAVALEPVLEQVTLPALIAGQGGAIFEMNSAARAVLSRAYRDLQRAIVDAIAGRPHKPRLQLVPLRAPGIAPHWLVLVPAVSPEERLQAQVALAAARWSFTPRETEVTRWLVRGASNQRIAAELACAEHTVEVHVSRILAKADVGSRTALAAQILSGDV